ncbi:MAG: PIN domain-containing protein [Oligoflexia bacterium]|nr:PIN domain-containing protein [Oligoflexia bacterium]
MILVDTSIWIEFFNKKTHTFITEASVGQIVISPPIIQEILQGIKSDLDNKKIKEILLSFTIVPSVMSVNLFLKASDIYRMGRKKGYTIRSSVDCLISAIAIDNGIPICHKDRDYTHIAKYTELKIINKF